VTATLQRPEAATPAFWKGRVALGVSVAIGLLAFAIYFTPALRVVQLNPDVVEYTDVARRLLNGEGFRLGVKAYHFGGTDVLHNGLSERPPLYPLLLGGLFALGLDLRAAQVVNAALAAISVGLVAEIGRALFGRPVGVAAGLLAAASPVVLARMIPPMTEAVTIVLLLLASLIVVRASEPVRRCEYLLAGAALGLGYLARPTTAALVLAVIPAIVLAASDRVGAGRAVGWLLLGVALFAVPMSLYGLATQGTLSYSGQSYLYAVHKDSEVLRNGYGQPLPTVVDFVSNNLDFIVVAILENGRDYANLLLLDREWLWPLAPAWIGVVVALVLGRYPRRALVPAMLALACFATYALTWANYQERYQLPTLLLLLPFLAHGLAQLGLARLPMGPLPASLPLFLAVLAVVWWWSPTIREQYRDQFRYGDEPVKPRVDAGLRWTGPPRWVEDNELARIADWIGANTARDDVLTHGQPWPYTFFTGRPATLLPTKLSGERLREFATEYHVAYVLLDLRDRDRRDYRADLEGLAGAGVRVTSVGSFRIYDTRPLWQTSAEPLAGPPGTSPSSETAADRSPR
jgi:4-amino-4-deoxy-L-arabinose transferase-like glycosyltransferase